MNLWIKTLFTVFALCLSGNVYAQQPKVFLISSYHPSYEWAEMCEKGIRTSFEGYATVTVYHMDTKRIPESEFEKRVDQAWAMYMDEKPDLVMLGDDNALRLMGPRLARTETPVVYYGINNNPQRYFDKIPPNITGLMERTPILPLLRYIRPIMPKAETVLILLDDSHTARAYVEMIFKKKKELHVNGFRVTYIISDDWAMWKKNIRTLAPSYDLLVSGSYYAVKKKDGTHVNLHEVIQWTSANSSVPVFTNQSFSIYDTGAVGAFVTIGENHGPQAAAIALKILKDGIKPEDISPDIDRSGSLYFNQKQLERFNLTLPEEIKEMAQFR